MRKAKAIITEEGGLTCHASIVARELKIPCIIGTKVATKLLKNNEVYEFPIEFFKAGLEQETKSNKENKK